MSHSILKNFDPHAVHPFTNSSGLMPKPTPPSQYPHPLPSPATIATPPTGGFMHAPQPSRALPQKKPSGTRQQPIFVPFRPDRSSPDLDDILLKKKVHDAMANKQTWSIDHAGVPIAARR